MNDRDSEALLGLFLEKGYVQAKDEKEADLILINTCSVRDHAENRAISYAGSLKKLPAIVGLIGCMARNRGEEVFKKMPHLSLICGPASFAKIPDYIGKIQKEKTRIIDLDDLKRDEQMYRAAFRIEPDHAQVVISTGCSNYCSYCVVPYVRGELCLRDPEDIELEVKGNIDLGIKKITLLGQNVNDYPNFTELLSRVEGVKGIGEINFITSQPRNIPDGLFEFIAKSDKVSKHLHLPFQSGSNRILKLMNRGYTKEKYLQLVDDYKRIVGGTLSSDLIVGFPSETDQDFFETKDILERVRFRKAYIFKYSPRPRAKSAAMKDDVSEEAKAKRHRILLNLQKQISLSKR